MFSLLNPTMTQDHFGGRKNLTQLALLAAMYPSRETDVQHMLVRQEVLSCC